MKIDTKSLFFLFLAFYGIASFSHIFAQSSNEKTPSRAGSVYLNAPEDMQFEKTGGNVVRRENEDLYTERRIAELGQAFEQFRNETDIRLKELEQEIRDLKSRKIPD